MYCSKRCKLNAWRRDNTDRWARLERLHKPKRLVSAYYAGYCLDCGVAVGCRHKKIRCVGCAENEQRRKASEAAVAAARRKHAAAGMVVVCEECKVEFCPLYGNKHLRFCRPCAVQRNKSAMRAYKLMRKKRYRGVDAEPVDPIKVFARDGWRCHLCGIKTPKSKRGTHAPNAPELDHIRTLNDNGAHTYANTACACRRCNQAKGAKSLGQLLLIG